MDKGQQGGCAVNEGLCDTKAAHSRARGIHSRARGFAREEGQLCDEAGLDELEPLDEDLRKAVDLSKCRVREDFPAVRGGAKAGKGTRAGEAIESFCSAGRPSVRTPRANNVAVSASPWGGSAGGKKNPNPTFSFQPRLPARFYRALRTEPPSFASKKLNTSRHPTPHPPPPLQSRCATQTNTLAQVVPVKFIAGKLARHKVVGAWKKTGVKNCAAAQT
ncbi:MAG: hypothetical protein BJ554DRAFT_6340 [Olpidium bornovanus]|uniref:Uncharacterized protein n=1 Tax=Olpidium bornovanus TaxID=278681 RepID=A0A8H7ZY36_9FUNG|nr:MAG: hypothetical protein BJ554DRAFT_6340 [Olpidium bornovanus]